MPGAYTGTCHKMHLPSIFLNAYAIKDKGVDTIAVVSVNDAFVMNAWKRDTDQRDEATFLADGNAEFAKAIGMELDASGNGLGIRSHRYSMLVDDGVVKKLNPEPAPGKVEFRRRYAAGPALNRSERHFYLLPCGALDCFAGEGLVIFGPAAGLTLAPRNDDDCCARAHHPFNRAIATPSRAS